MSRLRAGAAGLASGVVILAGCAGQLASGTAGARLSAGGGYRSTHGRGGPPARVLPLEAASGPDLAAAEEGDAGAPVLDYHPMPSPWSMTLVGAEFGVYSFTDEDIGDWFDDATYGGIKFAWEPGLNWGVSVSAGYYKARNRAEGGEDIEVYPVRATFELGGLLFFTQSRWFIGAGGGYAHMDEIPSEDKIDLWPALGLHLDGEWAAHMVGGFEFRNESIMALRIEGGHTWLFESDSDVWMVTGTLSLQF